jgi:hypothetical protein
MVAQFIRTPWKIALIYTILVYIGNKINCFLSSARDERFLCEYFVYRGAGRCDKTRRGSGGNCFERRLSFNACTFANGAFKCSLVNRNNKIVKRCRLWKCKIRHAISISHTKRVQKEKEEKSNRS